MQYQDVRYKGAIRLRWIQLTSDIAPEELKNQNTREQLYDKLVDIMKSIGKDVTKEEVKIIADGWDRI